MSVTVYRPSAIVFASGDPITQLDQLTPDYGFQPMTVHGAGQVLPGFSGNSMASPQLDFETTQVADVLSRATTDGFVGSFVGSNVDLQWRKAVNTSTMYAHASTEHVNQRIANSMLYWESISAPLEGSASVSAVLCPISVSGAAPIVTTTGVAITAGSVYDTFKLGPVNITTASVDKTLCTEGWRWSNNAQVSKHSCNGAKYVETAFVGRGEPTILIDVPDVADVMALLDDGEAVTAFDCYLRKMESGKIQVADGTAEHIKLSATAGSVRPVNPRQLQVIVHAFTVSTASAIT